ncbi:hypothetical protein FAEPRAA2165_01132 [Faecalibacterium duncaniae]|uniref:Uncharacterized protein n=1 Tax=Faecalibacterium duncaniae (strain DSM 17677 / JCM 31915 / A2-165) TaxID=411483 RepID=C7H4B9_FAED2|nr:hypothetical protein FAEPRAA2165_01132 [Faecalibacterium duncaniae]
MMEWPATTATAASGGCRELLLGPRPARRKRKRCECWEPQPDFTCVGIPRFPSALRFDAESAKFGKLCRP